MAATPRVESGTTCTCRIRRALPCPGTGHPEGIMSDQQFKAIILHLRIIIVTTGLAAGALFAIAREDTGQGQGTPPSPLGMRAD
jgi:hypothetical protein